VDYTWKLAYILIYFLYAPTQITSLLNIPDVEVIWKTRKNGWYQNYVEILFRDEFIFDAWENSLLRLMKPKKKFLQSKLV